jgi:uncharacterized membrane protein
MFRMSWITAAILSLLLFGVWGVIVKYSASRIDAVSFTLFNSVGAIVLIILVFGYSWFSKSNLSFTNEGIYFALIAGAVSIFAVILEAVALKTGNITIVGPLMAVGVAMVLTLAGVFIFKETLTMRTGIGLMLALVAIYLLSTT